MEELEPKEDNLPSILDKHDLTLNIPNPLSAESSLKQAKEADVQIANDMLAMGYIGLTEARSVSSIVKLGQFIMSTVKERRHLLNLQYGTNSEGSKGKVFDPLD